MRQGYLFDTKCCGMPLLLTAFGCIGQTERVTQKKNVRFVCGSRTSKFIKNRYLVMEAPLFLDE